ncbi:MAG: hypothetical protein JWN04_403 [Myxococcaceae bacterium]|nr:hypothetical protein [Myxococcaceae bacterium]
MDELEHIYIGILRGESWEVCSAEALTEEDLRDVNVMRELQSTLVFGGDAQAARAQIKRQVLLRKDPFMALSIEGHNSRGLALVRDRVQRALLVHS